VWRKIHAISTASDKRWRGKFSKSRFKDRVSTTRELEGQGRKDLCKKRRWGDQKASKKNMGDLGDCKHGGNSRESNKPERGEAVLTMGKDSKRGAKRYQARLKKTMTPQRLRVRVRSMYEEKRADIMARKGKEHNPQEQKKIRAQATQTTRKTQRGTE